MSPQQVGDIVSFYYHDFKWSPSYKAWKESRLKGWQGGASLLSGIKQQRLLAGIAESECNMAAAVYACHRPAGSWPTPGPKGQQGSRMSVDVAMAMVEWPCRCALTP